MFKKPLNSRIGRLQAWCDSLFVDHAVFRLGWTNFDTVIPKRVYRCNHPTPKRLARLARRYGICTLVNLRGQRACGSDALSRQAAHSLGLEHIDIAFESRGAPHKDRIIRFEALYRQARFPILLHCKSGADRAGLASGLTLLFEGHDSAAALGQLSWRYGHFSRSRTGVLDAFFLLYRHQAEGRIPFMQWVREEYDEQALRDTFVPGRLSSFVTDHVLKRE